jgi:hypothetical protein
MGAFSFDPIPLHYYGTWTSALCSTHQWKYCYFDCRITMGGIGLPSNLTQCGTQIPYSPNGLSKCLPKKFNIFKILKLKFSASSILLTRDKDLYQVYLNVFTLCVFGCLAFLELGFKSQIWKNNIIIFIFSILVLNFFWKNLN